MDNWVHTTSHSGICHAVHLASTFVPVHMCGQLLSCRFLDLQHIDCSSVHAPSTETDIVCSSVHAPSTETDMPHDYKRTCSDHMLKNCGSYQILLVNNTHTNSWVVQELVPLQRILTMISVSLCTLLALVTGLTYLFVHVASTLTGVTDLQQQRKT